MKKFIALTLMAIVLVTSMTACSTGTETLDGKYVDDGALTGYDALYFYKDGNMIAHMKDNGNIYHFHYSLSKKSHTLIFYYITNENLVNCATISNDLKTITLDNNTYALE